MKETLSFSSFSYSPAPGQINLRTDTTIQDNATKGTGLFLFENRWGLGFLWFERQAVKQPLGFLSTWQSWKPGLIRAGVRGDRMENRETRFGSGPFH